MQLLRAKGLKKNFGSVHALQGVDLELEQHKQYVIRGQSGSGKSTLLYLIGGLDRIWVNWTMNL
jgi:ABC-type sugar transport system ATPase subunit